MAETFAYVMNSAAWSLAGFFVGWLTCYRMFYTFTTKELPMSQQPQRKSSRTDAEKKVHNRVERGRLFGIFLVILAVLTVGGVVKQYRENHCQSEFNSNYTQVANARGRYADQDRAALLDFLKTFNAKPPPTAQERTDAFNKFVTTYERTGDQREKNPLPVLGKECG